MSTMLHFRARTALVLVACLAALTASLSLPRAAEASPLDCVGTSLAVDGPNGSSTTQPPGAIVLLKLVNQLGDLVPTTCQGLPLTFQWSSPDAIDFDFGAWPLTASVPTNQAFVYGHRDGEDVTLSVTATDAPVHMINVGGSVTLHFADPGPSGTSLAASPSAPETGQSVTLSAATTSPSDVQSWAWDFGDGTTASTPGNAPTVAHVYQSAGDHTASVTVTDYLGKTDTAQLPLHVTVAPAPLTAAFSLSSSSVTTGQSVGVDGTRSTTDPAGTITGWAWDFGDGTHGTGASTSHTYATAGTYHVVATVSDGTAQGTAAAYITVTQPAGGGVLTGNASVSARGYGAIFTLSTPRACVATGAHVTAALVIKHVKGKKYRIARVGRAVFSAGGKPTKIDRSAPYRVSLVLPSATPAGAAGKVTVSAFLTLTNGAHATKVLKIAVRACGVPGGLAARA
jgi:PKD repeat protein